MTNPSKIDVLPEYLSEENIWRVAQIYWDEMRERLNLPRADLPRSRRDFYEFAKRRLERDS
ncbi:MAG: hypothetical protein Tp178MES00d2C33159091_9 [Prokaryotic dsDNA virus sp.]|nr:MAG: hypothetical protein Tp178MES00d2C33159091_9 [Prokaryotic dsDNA virus sp.]QDP64537.1 MAG: hypothetical protein Tp178SUR1139111_57 [Prokaryotic dsDNA virus sp.]